jgi:hypothetical protein
VKYVILIHSNPDPWGHPTVRYTAEGRALTAGQVEQMDRDFEALLEELSANGEFVTAEALADPASATVYSWSGDRSVATDGPYAETNVHNHSNHRRWQARVTSVERLCLAYGGSQPQVEHGM